MKKILYFIITLLLVFNFLGCKKDKIDDLNITIEISDVRNIEIGEQLKLIVTLSGINEQTKYETSDENIITINSEGLLTGINKGIATITAYIDYNDKKYLDFVEIEVLEPKLPSHEHSLCEICGKCTNLECDGKEEDKCIGHENPVPPHDCELEKSDWISIEEIKCGESGIQQIICTECERVLEERIISIEHEYRSEITQEKTCTQNGITTYTCNNCDHSYTTKQTATGHVKKDIEILEPATSNTLGTKIIGCENCDYVYKKFQYVDNAYHANGKLSVKGADLVNQNGEKFQLFGLSTHGLQWFSKVVNFDTFCAIQESFGNNVFRLALYTDENGYCDGGTAKKQQMLETLKRGIDIATELGLYVIVDWHMVGAENVLDKNPLTYLEEAK